MAWLILLCSASVAWAVPPDVADNALEIMCQRGLAESAVEYCRTQLDLHIEQAPARSRWAMRLMECQAQSALRTTAVDANPKWEQVEKTEIDYRQRFADDPRLPWLAWQLARSELLRAQQSLAKWLATPAASVQRDQALQSVRKVQSLVDSLVKDIKERLPLAQNRSGPNPQATSRELHELQLDCALLRCESFLVRAKCYPNDSPDHLTALAEVDSTATDVFRQAAPDWSSRDELLVAQATAGLEVGKRRESLDLLIRTLLGQVMEGAKDPNIVSVPASPPSELARLRAGSALVEALCADGKPDQAAEFAKELAKNFSGPEVDMADLRVAIARMKLLPANNRPQALAAIVANTQAIGEKYGSYWRNRSEALLVAEASGNTDSSTTAIATKKNDQPKPSETAPAPSTSGMTELLAIEVRQLLAGGQTIAAIAKLRGAVAAAEQASQFDDALQLALEAARLMQKEKQWTEAAELLAPLAVAHPAAKSAAAAHALAAWCVAQSLKDSAPQTLEKRYEQLLTDQLAKWPDAPETLKGEEYLSTWLTSKKRYEDLATMWLDRAAHVSDIQRQHVALDQWLTALIARVPKTKVATQTNQLAKLITEKKLTACERSAKIVLVAAAMLTAPITQREAELQTGYPLPNHELQQLPGDESLLAALHMLDAVYRVHANDARTAAQSLELAQLTSTATLAWCKAMALAADELPESQIGQWTEVFERVQLPDENATLPTPALKMTKLRLDQLRAKSPDEHATGLANIKQLAQDNATDPLLQLTLAAAIAQSKLDQGKAERQAEATKLVKRVAIGTKKESEAHLRARWLEARWLVGRGDKTAAAQVARLTLNSSDNLPAWWKARFESLLE